MCILGKYRAKLALGTAVLVTVIMPFGVIPTNQLTVAYAAESVNLQVENPGLLPTNPFYFLKSFKRSAQRALTVNIVKKIDLELDILNQKAAEVQRLYEIMPDDNGVLFDALSSYQININNLAVSVKKLGEVDKDATFNRLTDKLVSHSVNHLKLFDEIKTAADIRLKEKLNNLQSGIGGMVADVILIEGVDKFKVQYLGILGNLSNDAIKELRAVEILGYFEEKFPVNSFERQLLARFKEGVVLSAEAILSIADGAQATLPASLEGLSGDAWRRIKMLDEAREYVKSSVLKNDLTLVRQLILDLAGQLRTIGKPEAERLANEARDLSNSLKDKNLNLKSAFLDAAILKAEFNLKQAQESMINGQYVYSFGQASAATAVLENALSQSLILMNNNLNNEIKTMKGKYDRLAAVSQENGLNKDNSLELFNFLSQAEKALTKLSDGKNKKFDAVVLAVRDAKLLLFKSEWFLNDMISRIEEKMKEKYESQTLIQKVLTDENKEREIKNEAIKEL